MDGASVESAFQSRITEDYTEILDQREFILCHNLLVDSLLNYYRSKALDAQVSLESTPTFRNLHDSIPCCALF